MVAEDHADTKASAKAIYNIIRERIMHCHKDNLLPLVYVLDSILKNVKGKFIEVIKVDVINWMSVVYRQLPKEQQAKLQKMWRTWNEFKIFDATSWKAMGECFDDQKTGASTVAGITRTVSRCYSTVLICMRSLIFAYIYIFSCALSTHLFSIPKEQWSLAAVDKPTARDAECTGRRAE